jgi:ubiquinone biosynthesis protein
MKKLKPLARLFYIYFTLLRFGLDEFIFVHPKLSRWRFFKKLNLLSWTQKKHPEGVRLRLAIIALGPIFVKFGQMLSTRRDVLSPEIADELAELQDRVPPFPGSTAKKLLETTYEKPLDTVFKTFDTQALASASIAQAHAATLHSGEEVIVKILRPNIRHELQRDLELMKTLAAIASRFFPKLSGLKLPALVEEFESTIYDELDLMREAANASQLRRNFLNSADLKIPKIMWPYCKTSVMVSERIFGIPIADLKSLRIHGINLRKCAEKCLNLFLTQAFRDNFFHADMHPGNIFVSKDHPENPQIILVDFGIMGSLSVSDKKYVGENFAAILSHNYQRVTELHIESGWLPKDIRADQFTSAMRTVCEPILERPVKDVSFGELLIRLIEVMEKFHINVQPQLLLFQKTLLNVEGLARHLDPEIDIWSTAKPVFEKFVREELSPIEVLKKLLKPVMEFIGKNCSSLRT